MVPSGDLTLSAAGPGSPHLPLAARWLSDAWGQDMGYDLEDTLNWCGELARARDETLILATVGDRLLGTVAVVGCDLEGHDHLTPWLSCLYVTASERGQGLGRSLARAAVDWARRKGYPLLYLYAPRGRLSDYYKDLGWQPMQDIDLNGEPFFIARKRVTTTGRDD